MQVPCPPRIVIAYCTQCHWLLRAAWMAQELLSTFGTDLGEVALAPRTGGVFEITCDGLTIWERKADGGFPDAKVLKQRVRDRLDPGHDLGHIDRPGLPDTASSEDATLPSFPCLSEQDHPVRASEHTPGRWPLSRHSAPNEPDHDRHHVRTRGLPGGVRCGSVGTCTR